MAKTSSLSFLRRSSAHQINKGGKPKGKTLKPELRAQNSKLKTTFSFNAVKFLNSIFLFSIHTLWFFFFSLSLPSLFQFQNKERKKEIAFHGEASSKRFVSETRSCCSRGTLSLHLLTPSVSVFMFN